MISIQGKGRRPPARYPHRPPCHLPRPQWPAGRVYHDNSACPPGRYIPVNERRPGSNNYRLCHDCGKLNDQTR
jgi:hypothetical protein